MTSIDRDAVVFCVKDARGRWLLAEKSTNGSAGQLSFPTASINKDNEISKEVIRVGFAELGVVVKPKKQVTTIDVPESGVRLHVWLISADVDEIHLSENYENPLWLSRSDVAMNPNVSKRVTAILTHLPKP